MIAWDIYIKHMFQIAKFWGHQCRSAWGQSFDLSLVWTYLHCNTAVFHLICNMPICIDFQFFNFQVPKRSGEVKSWSWEVTWSKVEKKCHKWYPWVQSFLLIYIMHKFQNALFWGHQRSIWVKIEGGGLNIEGGLVNGICGISPPPAPLALNQQ